MRFLRNRREPLAATVACSLAFVVGAASAALPGGKLTPHVAAKVVTKAEATTLIVRVTRKMSAKSSRFKTSATAPPTLSRVP